MAVFVVDKDHKPCETATDEQTKYNRERLPIPTQKISCMGRGSYSGKVAVRALRSFTIQTEKGVVEGISRKHCRLMQRGNGYSYEGLNKTTTEERVFLSR